MDKKWLFVLFLVIGLLVMPGCIGRVFSILCPYLGGNEGHCYQRAAVFDSDPDLCLDIPQPEEWKKAGSNPPKDKCYLMIAEKTGDDSVCGYIEGGLGSYSKEECYAAAAKKE